MSDTLHIVPTRRCLGLAVGAVLVLTACGPSSNRYLANRDEKVYLRVPSSWHNVDLSDSFADRLTQSTSDAKVISKTVVTTQPNAHEQNDLDGQSPFATMTVYQTTGQLNQLLSASLARKIGFVSFDPVLPDDADKDLSEVISFDPRPTNAKIAGSRIVYRTRSEKTTDWQLTVNLSTYFDPSASRLYALEVICSTTCYDKSSGQIDKIVNSWRIG